MKKITALVLAIIMTAAFTGCAPKEEPAAIEEPQATPEPEPQEVESTIEQNPVSAFYTGYKSATEAMEALFRSRLEDDKSAEAADTLIYLADHDMRVSEGNATFGWLLSTDTADQFASSVTGAAEGRGSIAPHGIVIDDGEEEAEEDEAEKPRLRLSLPMSSRPPYRTATGMRLQRRWMSRNRDMILSLNMLTE